MVWSLFWGDVPFGGDVQKFCQSSGGRWNFSFHEPTPCCPGFHCCPPEIVFTPRAWAAQCSAREPQDVTRSVLKSFGLQLLLRSHELPGRGHWSRKKMRVESASQASFASISPSLNPGFCVELGVKASFAFTC